MTQEILGRLERKGGEQDKKRKVQRNDWERGKQDGHDNIKFV
jgi:hypothetical protein